MTKRWGTQISCKTLIIKWIDFVPAGLKVVLDICDVNVTGKADKSSNRSTSVHLKHIPLVFVVLLTLPAGSLLLKRANIFQQDALLFWLEQGVAGFALCDTDEAYSQKVKSCSLIFILTFFAYTPHEMFITDPVGVEKHLKEIQ